MNSFLAKCASCKAQHNTFDTCRKVLGHTALQDSLAYCNVKLEDSGDLYRAFGSLAVCENGSQ